MSRTGTYITEKTRIAFENKRKRATIDLYPDALSAINQTASAKIASFDDTDIMNDSLSVDRYCNSSNIMEIGSAIASQINFKLYNREGAFDSLELVNKAIVIKTSAPGATSNVNLGVFLIDNVDDDEGILTITGLDLMVTFDKIIDRTYEQFKSEHSDVTLSNGVVYARGTAGWLMYHVINDCGYINYVYPAPTAWASDFPHYSDYNSFVNQAITDVPNMKNFTYRKVLMSICAFAGVSAFFDNIPKLNLSWVSRDSSNWLYTSKFDVTSANRYKGNVSKTGVQAKGINLSVVNNSGYYPYRYVVDRSEYINITSALSVDENENWGVPISYVSSLYENIPMPEYHLFETEILSSPYLFPLDMITYEKDGESYDCIITRVTATLNGRTYISGKEKPFNKVETNIETDWQNSKTGQTFAMINNRVNELENDHYLYMTDADELEYKGVIKNINGKPTYVYEEAF